MSKQSLLSVLRDLITAHTDLTVAGAIPRVRASGLRVTDGAVKKAFYNAKAAMRGAVPKAAPAAARETAPKPVMPASAAPSSASDLTSVLSNVALVNKVVGAAGGVEQARQVAEAVRSCGSVDEFLQHLELVAGIRTATA